MATPVKGQKGKTAAGPRTLVDLNGGDRTEEFEVSSEAYHAHDVDTLVGLARSSITDGLPTTEVTRRRTVFGPNMVAAAKAKSLLHRIWEQAANIVEAILLLSGILSAIFGEYTQCALIFAVIILNIYIGVAQEAQAEKATEAIKKMMSPTATVIRNGSKQAVDTIDLVPGDLVLVVAGDRIPADLRFVQVSNLQVIEAALTGESHAVTKTVLPVPEDSPLAERTCMGFSGTLVSSGQAAGVVVSTGAGTELGRINVMVSGVAAPQTPLLIQLEAFGRGLSLLCILIALITFFVAWQAQGMTVQEAATVAVSVAVASIPEGLPMVTTLVLALGIQTLAKHKAIIRQLPAVETLGCVTVICSDKTGTLTANAMTAVRVVTSVAMYGVTGTGYNPNGRLTAADPGSATGGGPAAPANPGSAAARAPSPSVLAASAEALPAATLQRIARLVVPGALCNDAVVRPPVVDEKVAKAAAVAAIVNGNSKATAVVTNPLQVAAQSSEAVRASLRVTATPDFVPGAVPVEDWVLTGDPTDGALITLAMKAGVADNVEEYQRQFPRVNMIPFDSDIKWMATMHDVQHPVTGDKVRVLYVKGAPDRLIARCATQAVRDDPWQSAPIDTAGWLARVKELSSQGLRVLALCQLVMPPTQDELAVEMVLNGAPRLQLNCLVAIIDPPRPEVPPAIAAALGGGVMVKMITGDAPDTARTIGAWIGIISPDVITGQMLQQMTDEELRKKCQACNIYARASPEHKLRIVQALQFHGEVVAMTGDGVNDAPALKKADVGVAMGLAGTEVAKEAAKVVLADDNFSTIVRAVRQGRGTYANLKKVLAFMLPTSFAQSFSLALAVFAGIPEPLTQIQVLFVNLVSAVTLGFVLALEEPEPGVMLLKPRKQGKAIVGKFMLWRTILASVLLIAAMLGLMEWQLRFEPCMVGDVVVDPLQQGNDSDCMKRGRTVALNVLVLCQCTYILNCRYLQSTSIRPSIITGNLYLLGFVLLNILLQVFVIYTPGVQTFFTMAPIGGVAWGLCFACAAGIFLIIEFEKVIGPRFLWPCVFPIIKCCRRVSPSLNNAFCRRVLPSAPHVGSEVTTVEQSRAAIESARILAAPHSLQALQPHPLMTVRTSVNLSNPAAAGFRQSLALSGGHAARASVRGAGAGAAVSVPVYNTAAPTHVGTDGAAAGLPGSTVFANPLTAAAGHGDHGDEAVDIPGTTRPLV